MKKKKMVAYIGTYTTEGEAGLNIYDVKEKGQEGEFLKLKREIRIGNPSYVLLSKDYEMLYSIVDEGLAAFKVEADGDLTFLNAKPIGGMRGCFLDIDSKRRYVFVAGFHDGRLSMIKLKRDGSVSGIADGVFHRGHALSASERRLDHPKITCVRLTPDEKFVCATDYGLNQMRVYAIDYSKGLIKPVETVRCAMDSSPRTVSFSPDGKFCYILTENTNSIEVYSYRTENDKPVFELIQRESVLKDAYVAAASTHMTMTEDGKYVFVTIDGMNYLSWLKRDKKSGKLERSGFSPVSGDYPKYVDFMPGTDEVIVLNHDSGEAKIFRVNYKEGYMLSCDKPTAVPRSNCICIKTIEE